MAGSSAGVFLPLPRINLASELALEVTPTNGTADHLYFSQARELREHTARWYEGALSGVEEEEEEEDDDDDDEDATEAAELELRKRRRFSAESMTESAPEEISFLLHLDVVEEIDIILTPSFMNAIKEVIDTTCAKVNLIRLQAPLTRLLTCHQHASLERTLDELHFFSSMLSSSIASKSIVRSAGFDVGCRLPAVVLSMVQETVVQEIDAFVSATCASDAVHHHF